jgi:hypothetical protein
VNGGGRAGRTQFVRADLNRANCSIRAMEKREVIR